VFRRTVSSIRSQGRLVVVSIKRGYNIGYNETDIRMKRSIAAFVTSMADNPGSAFCFSGLM